jgi:hypothetical protein
VVLVPAPSGIARIVSFGDPALVPTFERSAVIS